MLSANASNIVDIRWNAHFGPILKENQKIELCLKFPPRITQKLQDKTTNLI